MQMPQREEAGERGVKADPLSGAVSSEDKLPFLRPSGIFRISLLCSFIYLCRVTSKYSVQGGPPPPTSTPTPAFLPLTTAPLSFTCRDPCSPQYRPRSLVYSAWPVPSAFISIAHQWSWPSQLPWKPSEMSINASSFTYISKICLINLQKFLSCPWQVEAFYNSV